MAKQPGNYGIHTMNAQFWQNKNVFITGGTGFVGAAVAETLMNAGVHVVILERDQPTPSASAARGLRDRATFVRGDLSDEATLGRILNEYTIDTVFHIAAQAIVGVANRSPLSTFESNIRGTWNLLEACRRNPQVSRIVVASSDKAYGEPKYVPYTEEHPLLGLYPYDASKACTDILARSFGVTYDMPIAVTRCANIYGPGDMNLSRMIPGTIIAVLKGEVPVIRSDGTPRRDYIYIDDVVEAYLTLMQQLDQPEAWGEAFNFGTGAPTSVLDLFRTIIRLCGKQVEPKILNEAKHEIQEQYLSSEKAKQVLEWQPRYQLEEGLKKTIEWYWNYLNAEPA